MLFLFRLIHRHQSYIPASFLACGMELTPYAGSNWSQQLDFVHDRKRKDSSRHVILRVPSRMVHRQNASPGEDVSQCIAHMRSYAGRLTTVAIRSLVYKIRFLSD